MKTVTVELTEEELEALIDMAAAFLGPTPDCLAMDVEMAALAKLRAARPTEPT